MEELVAQVKALEEQIQNLKTQAEVEKKETEPVGEYRVVFPPKERKIPKFSGEKADYPLEDYLQEVRAVCESRGEVNSAGKAAILVANLEGQARDEIRCLNDKEQTDPVVIESTLKAIFGERLTMPQLMGRLYARRQGISETLQHYSLALKLIARRIKTAGGDASGVIRDVYIENVRARALRRELRQHVRSHPDATFSDVLEAARQWEDDAEEAGKKMASVSEQDAHVPSTDNEAKPITGDTSLAEKLDKQQQALTELANTVKQLVEAQSRPPRQGIRRQLICYYCNKPGHMAVDCRARQGPNGAQGAKVTQSQHKGGTPQGEGQVQKAPTTSVKKESGNESLLQ